MKNLSDRGYQVSQIVFFWIISLAFLVFTPIIVLFSLGYTFDGEANTFIKTGVISMETQPGKAQIYVDGNKLPDTTPYLLRGVLPKAQSIVFEKKGYFTYKTLVTVKPGMVTDINVALVPDREIYEQKSLPFDLYAYFTTKSIMEEKLICLTDKGIILCDSKFAVEKVITPQVMSEVTARSIKHMIYSGDKLILWNDKQIWVSSVEEENQADVTVISKVYETENNIKHVFLGLKKRYLMIQDDKEVKAIDIKNYSILYPIAKLETNDGEIYYDEDSDELYLYERDVQSSERTLKIKNLGTNFYAKLQELTYERDQNKKNP
ncbi:MAG: PEGA domain-containing protein [Candidatus Omnitrophica bacterium]|nr:PEGA domain-containing protein [Candidatus Omnitrophota bacterium]